MIKKKNSNHDSITMNKFIALLAFTAIIVLASAQIRGIKFISIFLMLNSFKI